MLERYERLNITFEFHVIRIPAAGRISSPNRNGTFVYGFIYDLLRWRRAMREGTIRRRFRGTYWRDRSDTRTWLAQRGKPKYFADTRPRWWRQKAVTRSCRLKNERTSYEEVDFFCFNYTIKWRKQKDLHC